MKSLQEAIEKSLADLPTLALATLLQRKLSEQGISINSGQAETFARDLLAGQSSFSLPGERSEPVQITLNEEDTDGILNRIQVFMDNDLEQLLLKLQEEAAVRILNTLRKRWPAEYRMQRSEIADFRTRIYERWKKGVSKLHMLITMAREFGDNINRDARRDAASSGPALVDVLTRLHARSCQVAEEVLVLLEAGFADGAMARWRTMHEIAVTAAFILEHGNECAERYTDHQIVDSFRGAREYKEIHVRLGFGAIPASDLAKIRRRYNGAIKKYGVSFGGQYGWAAKYMKAAPTFREIERVANVDHLRGHYRMASHPVHANPKGIFFSLTSIFPTKVLLAGPSNAGLADAGDGAAHSLMSVSAVVLSLSPNFDYQVALRMMSMLREEIGEEFLKAHQQLRAEEESIRISEKSAAWSEKGAADIPGDA